MRDVSCSADAVGGRGVYSGDRLRRRRTLAPFLCNHARGRNLYSDGHAQPCSTLDPLRSGVRRDLAFDFGQHFSEGACGVIPGADTLAVGKFHKLGYDSPEPPPCCLGGKRIEVVSLGRWLGGRSRRAAFRIRAQCIQRSSNRIAGGRIGPLPRPQLPLVAPQLHRGATCALFSRGKGISVGLCVKLFAVSKVGAGRPDEEEAVVRHRFLSNEPTSSCGSVYSVQTTVP